MPPLGPTAHKSPAPGTFTGWHMLGAVGAFFGVIIAVNITLAVYANNSWTGLVVKNSYVASQHFNEELADARRQAALGWTSGIELRDGQLSLTVRNGAGEAVTGLSVDAEIRRPTHDGENRTLSMTQGADGRYRAGLAVAAGQWSVEIAATGADGQRYRQIFRIYVKD